MATQIQLKDLTKRFDSTMPGAKGVGSGTIAVDHVNLTIERGELFFLLGPSGCGKTTLLRMIAGFIEPTSGAILFDDGKAGAAGETRQRDVTYTPPNKRNTGMVFQSYALWPHMTVAQNVGFGLEIRNITGDERERRIREALDVVQMGQYAQRKPNQLSGGQQQRVALARALVIRPDVLLLDEPLSNLDAKLRNELRTEIRRICKTTRGDKGEPGITAIYVTHDQKEALSMADRVAVVNQGKVVQVAPPAQMYRRPRNKFVAEFLGETNLVPGRIVERTGEQGKRVIVQTAMGRLVSAAISGDVDIEKALDARGTNDPAGAVLVSVRPEAVRIDSPDGANTLFARVRESTYLGETAQLLADVTATSSVEAAAGSGAVVEWKIATLNPGVHANVGAQITLAVDPQDVVVLPPGPPRKA